MTSRFRDLARRWASIAGLSSETVGAATPQQLMLAGVVRRGDELTTDAWLAALEALVDAREQRREPR